MDYVLECAKVESNHKANGIRKEAFANYMKA